MTSYTKFRIGVMTQRNLHKSSYLLKHIKRLVRGLHLQRLMRTPMFVELNQVSQHFNRVLQYLKPLQVYTLLLDVQKLGPQVVSIPRWPHHPIPQSQRVRCRMTD